MPSAQPSNTVSVHLFLLLFLSCFGGSVGCLSSSQQQQFGRSSKAMVFRSPLLKKRVVLEKHSLTKVVRSQDVCCRPVVEKKKEQKKLPVSQKTAMTKPSIVETRRSWFLPEPASWFVPRTQERKTVAQKAYPVIPFPKHRSFKWIKRRFLYQDWSFTRAILTRRGLYQKMIFKHLRQLRLPLGLFIVAGIESNFTPRLVSATGAMGMWQFIRSTGKHVGLKRNAWIDERRDVIKSTKASIRYLRSLYKLLGKWELAIAAYNCGPGCVQKALRRCKNRSIWTIRHWRGCGLSREASEYVARFYGLLYHWKHPPASKKMNGTFPTVPPLLFATVKTKGVVSLPALSKATGVSLRDLYELNPELSWWLTPPRVHYPLKVPTLFAAKIRNYINRKKRKIQWNVISVPRNQSLHQIGRKYNVSAYALKYVNRVWGEWSLAKRKYLVIPLPWGAKKWSRKWRAQKTLSALVLEGRRYSWRYPAYFRYWRRYRHPCYRVRRGDTLKVIAKRVYVSLRKLKKYNAGLGKIKPGMLVRLRSYSKCYRKKPKKKNTVPRLAN